MEKNEPHFLQAEEWGFLFNDYNQNLSIISAQGDVAL
jgi:hypothetical protein